MEFSFVRWPISKQKDIVPKINFNISKININNKRKNININEEKRN